MARAKLGPLKHIGVAGLIVCACLAGYLRKRPPLAASRASISIDGGYLEPTAMVGVSLSRDAEQTAPMDHRSGRPLFGMETEPVAGGLALKWRTVELEIDREEKVLNLVPRPHESFWISSPKVATKRAELALV
jgi:hypothetical protein